LRLEDFKATVHLIAIWQTAMPYPSIFISHRWARASHYSETVELFNRVKFDFLDESIPNDQALSQRHRDELMNSITGRIKDCDIFLIFDHPEVKNSEWCRFELKTAMQLGKRILIISPQDPTAVDFLHEVSSFNLYETITGKELRCESISTLIIAKIMILWVFDGAVNFLRSWP
jgi:hypothetical protein